MSAAPTTWSRSSGARHDPHRHHHRRARGAASAREPLYWVSAPKLYAECFGAPPSDGCYGFIAGVTAGVNGASLALTNRMPFCFTDTTTLEQVVETIVEDMRKQPENWTRNAPLRFLFSVS